MQRFVQKFSEYKHLTNKLSEAFAPLNELYLSKNSLPEITEEAKIKFLKTVFEKIEAEIL